MGKKILDGIRSINSTMKRVGNLTITTTKFSKKESEARKKAFELEQQEIRAQRARFLNEEVKELYGIEIQVCINCNGLIANGYQECSCGECCGEPLFK